MYVCIEYIVTLRTNLHYKERMLREIYNDYYVKRTGTLKDIYFLQIWSSAKLLLLDNKKIITLKPWKCIAKIDDLLETIRAWKVNKNYFLCYWNFTSHWYL